MEETNMSVLTEEQVLPLPETSSGRKPAKKRKKRKAKFAVFAVVLAALALGLPRFLEKGAESDVLGLSDTTVLSYSDLRSSVSATGTVESAKTFIHCFPPQVDEA